MNILSFKVNYRSTEQNTHKKNIYTRGLEL